VKIWENSGKPLFIATKKRKASANVHYRCWQQSLGTGKGYVMADGDKFWGTREWAKKWGGERIAGIPKGDRTGRGGGKNMGREEPQELETQNA